MANSTADAKNGSSSKSSANKLPQASLLYQDNFLLHNP
jgi:hypothetical protein